MYGGMFLFGICSASGDRVSLPFFLACMNLHGGNVITNSVILKEQPLDPQCRSTTVWPGMKLVTMHFFPGRKQRIYQPDPQRLWFLPGGLIVFNKMLVYSLV